VADAEELAARLEGIAEELADLALDLLRRNAEHLRAVGRAGGAGGGGAGGGAPGSGGAGGGAPDPVLTAMEKRVTRARRAVEKAVVLLHGLDDAGGSAGGSGRAGGWGIGDDGP
jgi:hypothetical protein